MPALSLDRAAAAPERSVAPLAHRQQPLSSATLLLPKLSPVPRGQFLHMPVHWSQATHPCKHPQQIIPVAFA